ncbi:BLUF domain-containing protein [Salegentibacter sp.]|uniref:BLUF domain-containing protein n=1 Tax=Salegentibacter sp. TaxID=1903072 RepID=UPI003564BA18
MRYAISYVSTANPNLNEEDIADLFEQVNKFNNSHDITGVLLYAETNFFQLVEGEKEVVKSLYSQIEKDSRHNNIIKFVDRPVDKPAFDGYISRFVTDTSKLDSSNLDTYQRHVEVLGPAERKAVERVLQSIAGE